MLDLQQSGPCSGEVACGCAPASAPPGARPGGLWSGGLQGLVARCRGCCGRALGPLRGWPLTQGAPCTYWAGRAVFRDPVPFLFLFVLLSTSVLDCVSYPSAADRFPPTAVGYPLAAVSYHATARYSATDAEVCLLFECCQRPACGQGSDSQETFYDLYNYSGPAFPCQYVMSCISGLTHFLFKITGSWMPTRP